MYSKFSWLLAHQTINTIQENASNHQWCVQYTNKQGGIHYLLNKLEQKEEPAYELIKQKLLSNTKLAVGADETDLKVVGDKHWAWTWQNKEATLISITDNRGQ